MKNGLPPTPLTRSPDMSLREWIEYYQASVVTKQVHYRGVPTWKNVFDL
jgi:cephalosporin hydroxylase